MNYKKDEIEKYFIVARKREDCLKFAKRKMINPIKCYMCESVEEAEKEKKSADEMKMPTVIFNIKH